MSNLTKILMLLGIGLFLTLASAYFVGGKKKEYDVSATIKARPYQLFPYLTDPELKKKWMTSLVDQEVITDGPIAEDTELNSVIRIDDENVDFRSLVIRFSKNEVLSIKSRNEELTWTTFFRLEGTDDVTKLDYRRILKNDGMRRLMAVLSEDEYQVELEKELANLVKLVESEVDNSIPDPDAVNIEADENAEGDDSESAEEVASSSASESAN